MTKEKILEKALLLACEKISFNEDEFEASAKSIAAKSGNIIEDIYYQIEDIVEELKESEKENDK